MYTSLCWYSCTSCPDLAYWFQLPVRYIFCYQGTYNIVGCSVANNFIFTYLFVTAFPTPPSIALGTLGMEIGNPNTNYISYSLNGTSVSNSGFWLNAQILNNGYSSFIVSVLAINPLMINYISIGSWDLTCIIYFILSFYHQYRLWSQVLKFYSADSQRIY
jgi:xanthosine utilization system XapX-like protein